MTSEYRKPIPEADEVSKTFWKGLQRRELLIQHCRDCDRYQFYPRPLCVHCWGEDLQWVRSEGRGTVYSYSIVRQNMMPGFAQEVPYVFAVVELEEGVRMSTNIVRCEPDKVTVGMPVVIEFERITNEITLPKFRPR